MIIIGYGKMLSGIDISYKKIERAYSDELVRMTIHNMFVILTKKKSKSF